MSPTSNPPLLARQTNSDIMVSPTNSSDHNYSIAVPTPIKEKIEPSTSSRVPINNMISPSSRLVVPLKFSSPQNGPLKAPEPIKVVNQYSTTNNSKNLLKIWSSQPSHKHVPFVTRMLDNSCLFNLYKCMNEFCTFSSSLEGQALEHFASHDSSTYECCYCDNMFVKANELVEHINSTHGNSHYACPSCFYRSISAYNCLVHQVRTVKLKLQSLNNFNSMFFTASLPQRLPTKSAGLPKNILNSSE